uniref:Trifunctional purine biosynthetic protein adenosine-3 n=1 Tax=Cacopsylla melanoneura TaxID=428564 RepID=A0A8D8UTY1_9HEMI
MSLHNKILIIGGGGREHALAWKLAQSDKVGKIYIAPGNAGAALLPKVENVSIDLKNFTVVAEWCRENEINLVVIGPEDPLANGISDVLQSHGIPCFGPTRAAARIEADKNWSKQFMDKYLIPTAKWQSFTDAKEATAFIEKCDFEARVVKASGLAGGKGVVVAKTRAEACLAVDAILTEHKFGRAGETVVIEEYLEGAEVSVLCFTDGKSVKVMPPSQDHKRKYNNDKGPNTGGLGAYCPCDILTEAQKKEIHDTILMRVIKKMIAEGTPFVGVLYAGLMMTKNGPKVLEFNARFGDPETQVILPLLKTDLYDIMVACINGSLSSLNIDWETNTFAVGVVMASQGYPETLSKGDVIQGLSEVSHLPRHLIFYSGVEDTNEGTVTSGGRVLITVALESELALAAAKATLACGRIQFRGSHYRTDIAHKGIARSLLSKGYLSYKESGVDIIAGNALIKGIKPCVNMTTRKGVIGDIGDFGALFDLKAAQYKEPVLVSGTDGVGTKVKIANKCNLHTTIGIDLVAMCVNDILAHGAEPLFFLDYFATGQLDVNVGTAVVEGIAQGCSLAGCALVGGETAELPGLYQPGDYDLAGFAVGAVEKASLLPKIKDVAAGDVVIALPSSGIHSNGFSLVRKVMQKVGAKYSDIAPFSQDGKTFGEELLTPTSIYVSRVLPSLKAGRVKAFAHITGGGLVENIPRVLSKKVKVRLNARSWKIHPVFGWLAAMGGVNESEMLRTFNCGIGAVLIVSPQHQHIVQSMVQGILVGVVEPMVVKSRMVQRKRVAVLISGTGTNLKSLLEATQIRGDIMRAEIVLVVSNKHNVEGLNIARNAGVPTKVIDHKNYDSRTSFDMALDKVLTNHGIQLVCLAGFMRILCAEFVNRWRGKLINIHPALLPLFKGMHAHKQALDAGVRITGCTVHFVEEGVDCGAIITQESVPIYPKDTEDSLCERVKSAEHKAYPRALELVSTERVKLDLDTGKMVWA